MSGLPENMQAALLTMIEEHARNSEQIAVLTKRQSELHNGIAVTFDMRRSPDDMLIMDLRDRWWLAVAVGVYYQQEEPCTPVVIAAGKYHLIRRNDHVRMVRLPDLSVLISHEPDDDHTVYIFDNAREVKGDEPCPRK